LPPCDLQCESCLARAAEAGDGDQSVRAKQPLQVGELALPADDVRERGRKVVPCVHSGHRLDLMAKNRSFELLQLRARLEAELAVEERPCLAVRGERVGLLAGSVQPEHELAPQPFAQGMLLHESAKLRHELCMTRECEVGVDAVLERSKSQLV
jgi:hypothetical protein